MASETDEDRQKQEAEAERFQQAMMLRYYPEAPRADRLSANIPAKRKQED